MTEICGHGDLKKLCGDLIPPHMIYVVKNIRIFDSTTKTSEH